MPPVESTRFDARDFVATGHDAYRTPPSSAGRWNWRHAAAVSGIAAALVLVTLVLKRLMVHGHGKLKRWAGQDKLEALSSEAVRHGHALLFWLARRNVREEMVS